MNRMGCMIAAVSAACCLVCCLHGCDAEKQYLTVETLYMNATNNCKRMVSNDDIGSHERYLVLSDEYQGVIPEDKKNNTFRQPECFVIFKFIDHLLTANITSWACYPELVDRGYPLLRVYDDCKELRRNVTRNLLVELTCSKNASEVIVQSSGSCLSIYHFRYHVLERYHFSIEVFASKDLYPFPVSTVAGAIVSSIAAIMIIIKIGCVVSGAESRLPRIPIAEDQKEILGSGGLDPEPSSPLPQMMVASGNSYVMHYTASQQHGSELEHSLDTHQHHPKGESFEHYEIPSRSPHCLSKTYMDEPAKTHKSHHATQEHATQQHATQQHTIQQHATQQHATQQHTTQQHATQQHATQQHTTQQHATQRHTPSTHITQATQDVAATQATPGQQLQSQAPSVNHGTVNNTRKKKCAHQSSQHKQHHVTV